MDMSHFLRHSPDGMLLFPEPRPAGMEAEKQLYVSAA